MTINKAELEHSKEMLRRNVAHLIHFAMWHRGVTLAELERRLEGRVSLRRLRRMMMGESKQARVTDVADIMTCLDMRVSIDLKDRALSEEPKP